MTTNVLVIDVGTSSTRVALASPDGSIVRARQEPTPPEVPFAGLVEFDTGKALYGLIQAGFVSRTGAKPTVAEAGGDTVIQEHLNLAVAFYRSGMLEDAAREFEAVLSADGAQPRARFMLALVSFRSGRLEEALSRFDTLPDDTRDSYAVRRNRALVMDFLGRSAEAFDDLDAAARAKPDDAGSAWPWSFRRSPRWPTTCKPPPHWSPT